MTDRGRWSPPGVLPELKGVKRLTLDLETTGLDKHKDLPVGIACCTDTGLNFYLPYRHDGGGNLDPAQVRRWAKRELRDMDIANINMPFDAAVLENDGISLEEQGCRLHELSHPPALLNEYRYGGFNLDALLQEYCQERKMACPVPPHRIKEAHSSMIGPYAESDAAKAMKLWQALTPLIQKEELERVLDVEDRLIYVVNHMERVGARLDVPKLHRWRREVSAEAQRLELELSKDAGRRTNPDSQPEMKALFEKLGLPHQDTFTAEVLIATKHPVVLKALRIRRLKSLLSKYLDKYAHVLQGDKLPFSLYQLRANDENRGTITGRFSSANVNIQQVMKVEQQIEDFGSEDFIIRELFIPDDGLEMFAADASQIEFRLFAHYSGSDRLIRRYHEEPDVDFHQIVADMIGQKRKDAKHNNFGKLYGMGIEKLAIRLGYTCTCAPFGTMREFWKKEHHGSSCPALVAIDIAATYDEEFPEAKRLMNKAMQLAEQRGYVKTLLGRRGRFPEKRGFHKAINKVIQGSAADINKLTLVELYRHRKDLGISKLRLTVHDEAVGDFHPDPAFKTRLKEFLDHPVLDLKVPILWDVETGANWRECA